MYLDWSTEVATLKSKIASLRLELDAWSNLVKVAPGPAQSVSSSEVSFSRHQSQILRLATLFEGIHSNLNMRLAQLKADDTGETKLELSKAILQACQFWAYFQSKFLTRFSTHSAPFLLAADEFAWACLKPLNIERAKSPGFNAKSPPLIYLGPSFSPFVIPTDWSLKSQIEGVKDQLFDQFMRRAPFAVLGLPFYQTTHLPEIMILAHEMGHVIDFDLGLTKSLDKAVAMLPDADVPPARKSLWAKCRIESFADVVGAAQGGPAFVESLAHFLSATVEDIPGEPFRDRGIYSYPTVYLRIVLAIEALRTKGKLPVRAEQIDKDWRTRFGPKHTLAELENDLEHIVRCYLDTTFAELNGKSIRQCMKIGIDDYNQAGELSKGMIKHKQRPDKANDPRVLMAAATTAYFDNPQLYEEHHIGKMVLERVARTVDNAPRSGDYIQACLAADREAGLQLALQLGS